MHTDFSSQSNIEKYFVSDVYWLVLVCFLNFFRVAHSDSYGLQAETKPGFERLVCELDAFWQ